MIIVIYLHLKVIIYQKSTAKNFQIQKFSNFLENVSKILLLDEDEELDSKDIILSIMQSYIENLKNNTDLFSLIIDNQVEEDLFFKSSKLIFIIMKYLRYVYKFIEFDVILNNTCKENNGVKNDNNFFNSSSNKNKLKSSINEEIVVNFDYKIIIDNRQAFKKLIEFYNKIIVSIELNFTSNYMGNTYSFSEQKLKKIYFDIPYKYYQLSSNTKFFFLNECKRDNQLAKLDELVDNIDLFNREISYHEQKSKSFSQSFFQMANIKSCEISLFIITLIINILLLLTLRKNLGSNNKLTKYEAQQNKLNDYDFVVLFEYLLLFFKIIQSLFCILILTLWINNRYLVYFKSIVNRLSNLKLKLNQKSLTKVEYLRICIWDSFLEKNEANAFLFILVISILSMYSDKGSFFYGLQLASFINLNKYLKNIILVIQKRYEQLMQTFILLITVVYLFSLIAFYFFFEEFNNDDLNENMCQTMLQCFITEINYALRSDGGIMPIRSYFIDGNIALKRLAFDLLFFFPINILLLNSILGIIVDTFKELREKKDYYDYDKENVCFICGLNRHEIKSRGDNFEEHCEIDHNVWNYTYFLLNLNKLQGLDMNTYELYVDTLIKNDDYSFFPNKNYWSINK